MPPVTNEPSVPSAEEALLAREISLALEHGHGQDQPLRLLTSDAQNLELPPTAVELLMEILKQMAEGNAVSLAAIELEITPRQAAELLNVSRPYIMGLIEKGDLPSRMVGSHYRLPLSDVLAYKAAHRESRRAALAELAAIDQELSLR